MRGLVVDVMYLGFQVGKVVALVAGVYGMTFFAFLVE